MGEWDIKLKMNDLTKRKIRLSMSLIANIMVANDYFLNCIFYYGYVF